MTKDCNHNSALKYVNNFKKIIRIAVGNDWISKDPFYNYKVQFKTVISKAQTTKSTNSAGPIPNNSKIKEKIAELVKRKFYKTKSNSDQLFYKTNFMLSGLSDILYNIASFMKVCIIAIDNADTGYNTQLPQSIVIYTLLWSMLCNCFNLSRWSIWRKLYRLTI